MSAILHQALLSSYPSPISVSGTAWNPSDRSFNFVLSNSNRTATKVISDQGGIRGVSSKSTGKWYVEYSFDVNGTPTESFGLASSATSIGAISSLDNMGGVYLIWSTNGTIFRQGSSVTNPGFPSPAQGNRIGFSVDFDAGGVVQIYRNGGNIAAAQTLGATPLFPFYRSGTGINDVVTIVDVPLHLPVGFSYWN